MPSNSIGDDLLLTAARLFTGLFTEDNPDDGADDSDDDMESNADTRSSASRPSPTNHFVGTDTISHSPYSDTVSVPFGDRTATNQSRYDESSLWQPSSSSPSDTTMPNIDSSSDAPSDELTLGIEVEYPFSPDRTERSWTHPGQSSGRFCEEYRSEEGSSWEHGGVMTHDGTVGAEITSNRIQRSDAASWYARTLRTAEDYSGRAHEPVGLMENNTAGLHIHLSRLNRYQAEDLWEVSQEPWMQVFACSSLARMGPDNYSVFRGGQYCRTNHFDGGRYQAVHSVNAADGHWEWRLPEPMTAEHFELLVEFLSRWRSDPADGKRWAQNLVLDADDRITAFRRADAIGLDAHFTDDDNAYSVELARMPIEADSDSTEFYWQVAEGNDMPFIYRARLETGAVYYYLRSPSHDADAEYRVDDFGVEFTNDTVISPDSLTPVEDDDIHDSIVDAIENPHDPENEVRTTDATDVLAQAAGYIDGDTAEVTPEPAD